MQNLLSLQITKHEKYQIFMDSNVLLFLHLNVLGNFLLYLFIKGDYSRPLWGFY